MHPKHFIPTLAILILFNASQALAQKISLGLVGGASLTDGFKDEFYPESGIPSPFIGSRRFSESKDYIIGARLEVHLNPRWSVAVDGLFRKLHMTQAAVERDGSSSSVSPAPVITWQFPVLAKYRFGGLGLNPFLEAGPSFRTAGNLNGTNPSHRGATAGLGFEIPWKSWRIAPVARYTRWAMDRNELYRGTTAPNQVELLVGFSRRAESDWRPAGPRVSVGFVMGTNLTGDYRNTSQQTALDESQIATFNLFSGPRRVIPGAMVELHLPRQFSIEVDALYRLISTASEQINPDGRRIKSTYSFVTWEFPVLAKYRFSVRGLKPFVGVGPSFRRPQTLTTSSPYGVVAGAGVEFAVFNRLKVAPTLRYTHWAPDNMVTSGGPRRNQTQVLVGFSF